MLFTFFKALAKLFILKALFLLIVQRHAACSCFLRQRVHSYHISLGQVVLVLYPIFYQVLKLLHLNFDNVLVYIRVARRYGSRTV